jgi:Domain of unknown function (DUF4755)
MMFIAVLLFAFGIGVIQNSMLAGLLMWVLAGVIAYYQMRENPKEAALKAKVQDFDYKHTYQGTAIGFSVPNQSIYLVANDLEKTYKFEEVRSWETKLQTGGGMIGGSGLHGGLQAIGENIRVRRENADASGLFIYVKDIDHPKWHIKFEADQKSDIELSRWMEILRQHINENVTA